MRIRYKHVKFVLITNYSIICKWNTNLTTSDNLLAAYDYVAFRSQHPDQETVKDVLKELQANNVDINHLEEVRADQYQ